jgi:hypothetical protein
MRRIVDIEWNVVTAQQRREYGRVSSYNIVSTCVERDGQPVVADTNYEPYAINDTLHRMINFCDRSMNVGYNIISDCGGVEETKGDN